MPEIIEQLTPSLQRALRGLSSEYQSLLIKRYERILPILLLLMHSRDIYERNRTWPGVSPIGKGATRWLSLKQAKHGHVLIQSYAEQHDENASELWELFHAYCRYGPIGLIEAIPSTLPSITPNELQECATFHRLAKHPRSDAGLYIRELLNEYAEHLGYERLPPFVARYAFASDRRLENWYMAESAATAHVAKTTRRLNLPIAFPHHCWVMGIKPLPITCRLSRRRSALIEPWLVWMRDEHTDTLMGLHLCPDIPSLPDVMLTLRWSIWHFAAPWWQARGSPDQLIVPTTYAPLKDIASDALRYLRIVVRSSDVDAFAPDIPQNSTSEHPLLARAITLLQQRQRVRNDLSNFTLLEIYALLLETLAELQHKATYAAAVPEYLRERGVSLPWSDGIAATALLPPADVQILSDNHVIVQGVPYEIPTPVTLIGKPVSAHIDPDDARQVALIVGRAQVVIARASSFEHNLSWADLIQ